MRHAGTLAVVVLAAWVALRLVFGIAGGIVGMLLGLAWFGLKLLLVLGAVYWVMTLIAPDTIAKMKGKPAGNPENL